MNDKELGRLVERTDGAFMCFTMYGSLTFENQGTWLTGYSLNPWELDYLAQQLLGSKDGVFLMNRFLAVLVVLAAVLGIYVASIT